VFAEGKATVCWKDEGNKLVNSGVSYLINPTLQIWETKYAWTHCAF